MTSFSPLRICQISLVYLLTSTGCSTEALSLSLSGTVTVTNTMLRQCQAMIRMTSRPVTRYAYRPHAVRLLSAFVDTDSLTETDDDYHTFDDGSTIPFLPSQHSKPSITPANLPDYMQVTLPGPRRIDVAILTSVDIQNLASKPVPGGNWNPADPLGWTTTFGRRSLETAKHLTPLVKLGPGDEKYFDVSDMVIPGVTIVRTKEQAQIVLNHLYAADPSIYHACDTEVMEIDLGTKGPIGNGYVTCVSIYSGPEFDYGFGPGTALWIDNLDDSAGNIQLFKDWFADDRFKKVWHNYGFDRHIMWNEGIDCRGFGGDTMHMARLLDTNRSKLGQGKGYSLEALTGDFLERRKTPMKELFGVKRTRKDGTDGLLVDIPPMEVLQRDPHFRAEWIKYSCYDAEGTWLLRLNLQQLLQNTKWQQGKNLFEYYEMFMRVFGEVLTDMERRGIRVDAKEYLAGVEVQARKDRAHHMEVFRQWAAKKIGTHGLALNPASATQLSTFLFGGADNTKTKEPTEKVRTFKVPSNEIPENALAAYEKDRQNEAASSGTSPDDILDSLSQVELKNLCKLNGLRQAGNKAEVKERIRGFLLAPPDRMSEDVDVMTLDEVIDMCRVRGIAHNETNEKQMRKSLKEDNNFSQGLLSANTPNSVNMFETIRHALQSLAENNPELQMTLDKICAKKESTPKYIDVTVTSLGMKPEKFTAGGAPSVTSDVIKTLAGDPFRKEPKYGTAMRFFKSDEEGREACEALYSLGAIGSIDTMIANFLSSLQYLADEESRVHCSLNLNTETGRLSSRRPNLQNQPALEKDTYKIRKAFQASPGNNLIVADYGQLELRLLASMTNCVSMIEAFKAGGDFHSRTAIDMYDYVKKSVTDGDCLLEWDYEQGAPPKPLLKDKFASERRQAKTLNFSIAYGKTAYGLSTDWGISKAAAEETVQKWYNARPEVLRWQSATKAHARKFGVTRTMMGRYRHIPEAQSNVKKLVGHAERAAINTPIQGGAADVAMMAMIKINNSEKLQRLGWVLLLQIHDEVILEGPEETAAEAFEVVIDCMQSPWVFGLSQTAVPLLVDGSYEHKNWYEAK